MELEVKDMTCGHWAGVITKAVRDVDAQAKADIDVATKRVRGVTRTSVNLATEKASIEAESLQAQAAVADAVRAAGYEVPEQEVVLSTNGMTSDNKGAAQAVAEKLGIGAVSAEVLPEDKARVVSELRASGRTVGMVDDGINDAPALAAAGVGIAMASETDVAMHAAGITQMRGDPSLIADAIDVSRRTYWKIQQNLFWAFIYSVVGVPLAALGLLSLVVAGAAKAFSRVSVVSNALMLRLCSPDRRLLADPLIVRSTDVLADAQEVNIFLEEFPFPRSGRVMAALHSDDHRCDHRRPVWRQAAQAHEQTSPARHRDHHWNGFDGLVLRQGLKSRRSSKGFRRE
jgi:cation transport ATPase